MNTTFFKYTKRALWLSLVLASPVDARADLDIKYSGIPHDALYDICFTNDVGVAVGAHGLLLQSRNGGESWKKVESDKLDKALLGVACSDNGVLSVGQEGAVYRLNNGKISELESGTDQRLLSVSVNESGLAYAVGGFGTVLRSVDGGEHWHFISIDWEAILGDFLEPHIYDVKVDAQGVVTLVGEFGLILKSYDDGKNWITTHKGEASVFALHLRDSGHGVAVGQNGLVLKTADSGKSWSTLESGTTSNLLGVWLFDSGKFHIGGIRTMLSGLSSGNRINNTDVPEMELGWHQGMAVAPSASGSDSDRGDKLFIVGHSGRILHIKNSSEHTKNK